MSRLSERPEGERPEGRSRTSAPACTSPARRCTPTTSSGGLRTSSTPTPCSRRIPTPGSPTCGSHRHTTSRGGASAHGRRRSRRQRRRRQGRRAAVPGRGEVCRTCHLLGARREPRGRPARLGRGGGRLRAAARRRGSARGHRGGVRSRAVSRRSSAATSGAASTAPLTCSAARPRSPDRNTSTSRRTARSSTSTRPGRSSSSRARSTRRRRRSSSPRCCAVPRHAVTVQCLRMGGGFGGKEMQPHGYRRGRRARRAAHRSAGPRAAHPCPGHDDDRQASRLPCPVAGGLRRRRAAAGPRRHPDLRRRLEPRPLRAGAGSRPVPRRQRLLDPRTCGSMAASPRPTRPPRRRSAASAARRGCSSSRTSSAGARRCSGIDPAELRRRNFYAEGQPTPYGQPVRHPERLGRAGTQVRGTPRSTRRRADVAASTRPTRTRSGVSPMTPVKFGISFNFTAFNQAGALVHVYTDGSVLVTHGGTEMGQGLHTKMLQVAATRARAAAASVCGWRRRAPTRCPTPRRRRRARAPTSTAARSSTPASRSSTGSRSWRQTTRGRALSRASPRRVTAGAEASLLGRRSSPAYPSASSCGRPASTAPRASTGTRRRCTGTPFKYFAYGVAATRGRGRRLHRRAPDPAASTSSTTSATPVSAGRPRPDRGRIRPGRRLADPGGPALGRDDGRPGRLATQAASTYKLPRCSEMPEVFTSPCSSAPTRTARSTVPRRSASPRSCWRFSVREALREAAAAFGPPGAARRPRRPPPRPEAVWWAIECGSSRRPESTGT